MAWRFKFVFKSFALPSLLLLTALLSHFKAVELIFICPFLEFKCFPNLYYKY